MSKMNSIQNDKKWMRQAISLSRLLAGKTHPNPSVGCVIVKNENKISSGFHHGQGKPHAEIEALKKCPEGKAKGATCYVTLEPCNHYGKTPPCTEALIKAGIKRVVIAIKDPNPNVRGNGIARLRNAGIEVVTGVLVDQAQKVIEGWIKWVTTGLSFVVLKMAMSLDGHVSTHTGDSKWISCEKSRKVTHKLRQQLTGIMAGAGTVLCDNPALTARKNGRIISAPDRIIVDRYAEAPADAQVFNPDMPGKTIWVVPEEKASAANIRSGKGAIILPCETQGKGLNLHQMMVTLGSEFSIESILLEGGPTLAFSLLKAKLIDKVMIFIAPILIGGLTAPPALGGEGYAYLSEVPTLVERKVRKIGSDVLIEGYLGERICLPESSEKQE